nr:hypothetical protein [Tanacetum cinerariifolium]
MTVNEYCTKIQAMKNRLNNLDCEVSEENMMIFVVNGLDSRFATLAKIIHHREPLPTFETVHNMLLLKESSFNNDSTSTTFEISSSSLSILMASSSSNTKGNTNTQSKSQNLTYLCNYFSRGTCKFRDRCKFIHDHQNMAGLNAINNTQCATVSVQNNLGSGLSLHQIAKPIPGPCPTSPKLWSHLSTTQHPAKEHWTNRDNNCTIEFDAFGFSMKDFLTRHILLRCDNSGDFYPVTKSLNLPHKFHADCALSRYKACLVANDSNQQRDVNFDETFSLVVKPATIRTVLSLVVSRQWPIHQLDVKNAFLNGVLSKTLYMHQLPCFVDSRYPNHGSHVAYLLIYVDDIILTTSSPVPLQQIVDSLYNDFDMTDLVVINYFLGISAVCHPTVLFLSQKEYALQLLERAHMINYNPSQTPVDTDSKLSPDGVPFQDPTLYRSLAGGSSILPLFAQICPMQFNRFVSICMIQGSCTLLLSSVSCGMFRALLSLVFTYMILLLYLSAKRQHIISRSRAEAEYRGVANVIAETAWLRNLLRELHSPLLTATLVYCDNVSAVYISANPVQHQQTKHIQIDIHFVHDMVKADHVRVLHVPSRFQYANIFTKGLPSALFEDIRSSLSVRPPPA